jgi:hypothetical protein
MCFLPESTIRPRQVQFPLTYLGSTNPKDFKIVDTGVVGNGPPTLIAGATGCNGVTLGNTTGCGAGNPSQYCFADIQFKPIEFGTPLTSNITFQTQYPNEPDNIACVDPFDHYLLNYVADPVSLKGTGSGFTVTLPQNGVPVAISVPTSTSDPGSATVQYQAQATSADTIKWDTQFRYEPSSGKEIPTVVETEFKTGGAEPAEGSYLYR